MICMESETTEKRIFLSDLFPKNPLFSGLGIFLQNIRIRHETARLTQSRAEYSAPVLPLTF